MAQVVAPPPAGGGKVDSPRISIQLQRSFLLFAKLRFLKDNNDTKHQNEGNGAHSKKKKRLWADDSDDDETTDTFPSSSNVLGAQQALLQDLDVTLCDGSKMMTHILDCVAALYEVQEEQQYLECQEDLQDTKTNETEKLKREEERAKINATGHALNKTFQFALSRLAGRLDCGVSSVDSTERKETATALTDVSHLYTAFPDDTKLKDKRGWLPLHWAVSSGLAIIISLCIVVSYVLLYGCHRTFSNP